jgi:outer membrane protein assembly factor BamB
MTLGIASGQQPVRSLEPQPLPLLPAEEAWAATLSSPPSAGGAMDEHRVYIPQQDQQLTALDRETGEVVWSRHVETSWPPVVGGGAVYVATRDDVHSVDAATGDTRWQASIGRLILAPITFDTGWILAVLERGDVIALRASDGREVWRSRVGDGDRPLSPPVPGERDVFYLTLDEGQVVAMSLTDGRQVWEQRLPGILSPPAWAPGRVFVGSTDNMFYALDAASGELAWKWRSGGDVIGAAADEDTVVFVSLDNVVRAVNRGNGNQRWRKETGTRPIVPPRAFGRLALVAGISPTLRTYSAKDGSALGTHIAPGDLEGPPLVDPDVTPFKVAVVLVMRNGQVSGLSPVGLLFREQAVVPATGLPGRPLRREPAPSVHTD